MTTDTSSSSSSSAPASKAAAAPPSSPSSTSPQQQSQLPSSSTTDDILNINIGVLGHVDSGKTSLVKTLSTLLSTAALDKSKQSKQRGMTLDLGFSCFYLDLPQHLRGIYPTKTKLQMTLVDCPGHASLIRTIIGGAQIIDIVLLVVDAYKGWQAQTTECLVLAELTTSHMVIALNKIDMFTEEERQVKIEDAKQKVRERLKQSTKFSPDTTPMIGVSACIGGEKVAATTTGGNSALDTVHQQTINVDKLIELLQQSLPAPKRHRSAEQSTSSLSLKTKSSSLSSQQQSFYFAIDHCFPIKGMGTVLTGTTLAGTIKVNDVIEFPSLAIQRKIKSIQMFKQRTMQIGQGDRAGICVSNFDSTLLERGVCATPGTVHLFKGAIAVVRKIPQYPASTLKSNSKYHVSVGHTTVMATVSFWGAKELYDYINNQNHNNDNENDDNNNNDTTKGNSKSNIVTASNALGVDADQAGIPYLQFDWNHDFLLQPEGLIETLPTNSIATTNGSSNSTTAAELNESSSTSTTTPASYTNKKPLLHWAVLDFQTPVYCPIQSLIIGSRLDAAVDKTTKHGTTKDDTTVDLDDTTTTASSCRLAFCGRLVERIDPKKDITRIRWYTPKEKQGTISRLGDPYKRQDDNKTVRYEVFGTDLFKKETILKPFLGMKLITSPHGDIGELKSAFGTSGKFRVYFPAGTTAKEGDVLILPFKRYIHDPEKKMRQDDIILPPSRPGTRIETSTKKNKKGGGNAKQSLVEATGIVDKVKGDVLEGSNDDKKKYPMAIITGFFTPEVDIRSMIGRKVWIPSTKEEGKIAGAFGKAGKCKVSFDNGISESATGSKAELHVATS